MIPLKLATAITVNVGPFVDTADGFTAKTGLTIAQAAIRLSKNGGNFAQSHNAAGATHNENGFYSVPLDTTDTDTCGRLKVAITASGALPCWVDCEVLPAAVFDALYPASGTSAGLPALLAATQGSYAPAKAGDAMDVVAAPSSTAIAVIKTGLGLPASPAAVGSAMTLTTAYDAAKSAAPAGDVTAIKNKTDNLPASPAATGAQMALTSGAINAVAAAVSGEPGAGEVQPVYADIIDHYAE
jgi:hypothetical protein